MILEFEGTTIWWKGPAPFVFVPTPPSVSADIKAVSNQVSYGWGCISVMATIGGTTYKTALFPKDGAYLVPVKVAVQRAENVEVGSHVHVEIRISLPS